MKLLVIMYQDFTQSFGAVRKYTEMISFLANHYEIILICLRGKPEIKAQKVYEIICTPPHKKDLQSYSLLKVVLRYVRFYMNQLELLLLVLRQHRDIKVAHIRHDTYSWPSTLLLTLLGKRIIADGKIYSSYAPQYDKRLNIIKLPMFLIEKMTLKRYSYFHTDSLVFKKELVKFGMSEANVAFIPVSLDLQKFKMSPCNENNRYNIAYFGELYDYSNVSYLIDAFALIKQQYTQSKLYIIGNGECFSSLKEQVKQLGLDKDVIFTGYVTHEELHLMFSNFCITVNPTKLFAGVGSTKRNEALAAGKIVLEAAPNDKTNLDDTDTIIYFDCTEPSNLAQTVCDLFKNPDLMLEYTQRSVMLAHRKYGLDNYRKITQIITSYSKEGMT